VVGDALVATQRWGKQTSAAVTQHATIEEVMFSVGAVPSLYNEDLRELESEVTESPELALDRK
jgi:hypothetical protein